MTTRAQFRDMVRTELGDTGTSPVWSDGLLNGFINEALGELSLDWPITGLHSIAAVVGQQDYVIVWPTGGLPGPQGIYRVEYPAGIVVGPGDTSQQFENGLNTGQPFEQCREVLVEAFDSWRLRFRYPLAESGFINLQYHKLYTLPGSDSTGLEVSGLAEVALKWNSCYRAYSWLDGQRGKRSGEGIAGNQGSSGYYRQKYLAIIAARKRAAGVGISNLKSKI